MKRAGTILFNGRLVRLPVLGTLPVDSYYTVSAVARWHTTVVFQSGGVARRRSLEQSFIFFWSSKRRTHHEHEHAVWTKPNEQGRLCLRKEKKSAAACCSLSIVLYKVSISALLAKLVVMSAALQQDTFVDVRSFIRSCSRSRNSSIESIDSNAICYWRLSLRARTQWRSQFIPVMVIKHKCSADRITHEYVMLANLPLSVEGATPRMYVPFLPVHTREIPQPSQVKSSQDKSRQYMFHPMNQGRNQTKCMYHFLFSSTSVRSPESI